MTEKDTTITDEVAAAHTKVTAADPAADAALEPDLAREREDEALKNADAVRGEDGVAL